MSKVNSLSQCKTVKTFNKFSNQLDFQASFRGRFFRYKDERGHLHSYTMNQLTHQFMLCVKKSERNLPKNQNALRKHRLSVLDGYDTLQKLNENKIKYPTCLHRLSKILGNFFYRMTHKGSSKEIIFSWIHKNYSNPADKSKKSVSGKKPKIVLDKPADIPKEVSEELDREAAVDPEEKINTTLDFINTNLLNHDFSKILDDSSMQSDVIEQLTAFPLDERAAILAYAKEKKLESFLNQYIIKILERTLEDNACSENLLNSIQTALEEEGFSLEDVVNNRTLFESKPSLFQNSTLKNSLIKYSKFNECFICIDFYLDFAFLNHSAEISEDNILEWIQNELEIDETSFNDILENPKNYSSLLQTPSILPALVTYAQENSLNHFLDYHFEDLCQRIYRNFKYNNKILNHGLDAEFQKEGRTINEILKDFDTFKNIKSRSALFRDPIILTSIVSHAKINGNTDFLDAHLNSLLNEMKTSYGYLPPPYDIQTIRNYTSQIKAIFTDEGRSLDEILDVTWLEQNPESRKELYGRFFRSIVIRYARTNDITEFLDYHLECVFDELANKVINGFVPYSDTYFNDKLKKNGHRLEEALVNQKILKNLVNKYFSKFHTNFTSSIVKYAKTNNIDVATNTFINRLFYDIFKGVDQLFNLHSKNRHNVPFLNSIETVCTSVGFSIKEIFMCSKTLNNKNKRALMFQKDCLRKALVEHAKANDEDTFLTYHLKFLCKKVINDPALNSIDDPVHLLNALESEFESEGRQIDEIFSTNLVGKLSKIETFNKALVFYKNKKLKFNNLQSKESSVDDFSDNRIAQAERLGIEHAQIDSHLIPRLNLQDSLANMATLKKATLAYLRKNHPDQNPNANQDLVRDATQLLELINQGNYKVYNEAFKSEKRSQM